MSIKVSLTNVRSIDKSLIASFHFVKIVVRDVFVTCNAAHVYFGCSDDIELVYEFFFM